MKEKIKAILMSLRTVNNSSVVNYFLGEIDMKSDEEIISILGEDETLYEEKLQAIVDERLQQLVESGKFRAYGNSKKDNRESRTFADIKKAYSELRTILDSFGLETFIAGGTVPYFLLGEDSGRLHDDIDTVCRMEDIEKIRDAFKRIGIYNPELDSKTHSPDGQDYGFEIVLNGVPICFSPFTYQDGILSQRSYDPYIHSCKIQEAELANINDYIYEYKSKDGTVFQTMSLEYIKKTKDRTVGRPKDIADSQAIERTGLLRQDVLERIHLPRLVSEIKPTETQRTPDDD